MADGIQNTTLNVTGPVAATTNAAGGFAPGQTLRGVVVAIGDRAASVVFSGVTTTLTGRANLQVGQRLVAHVDAVEGSTVRVTLLDPRSGGSTPAASALEALPQRWLSALGLPTDTRAQTVTQMLRQHQLLTPEFFRQADQMLMGSGLPLDQPLLDAAGILLARGLVSSDAIKRVRRLLTGELRLGNILARLGPATEGGLAALASAWSTGKLLSFLFGKEPASTLPGPDGSIPADPDLLDALMLSTDLTVAATAEREGRTFFQWPIFWADSEIPDTLEGEAWVPAGSATDQGFSFRLAMCPPAFGNLEIHVHRLENAVWINLGFERFSDKPTTDALVGAIESAVKRLSYADVRVTTSRAAPHQSILLPSGKPPEIAPPKPRLNLQV